MQHRYRDEDIDDGNEDGKGDDIQNYVNCGDNKDKDMVMMTIMMKAMVVMEMVAMLQLLMIIGMMM